MKGIRDSLDGDQIVTVTVEIPKKLSKEEKELYEKLKKIQSKQNESVFGKFKKAFK